MTFRFSAVTVFFVLGLSATAHAECIYPRIPAAAPNGATAAQAELAAAIQDMKRFDTEITTYAACVDRDAMNQIIAGGTIYSADYIKQILAEATQKHNAGVDDLQRRADALNAQVRIFQARAPAK